MAEFRWIKTSLVLILVLQFTAAAIEQSLIYITVRDGDEVTLPCDNVIDGQKKCNSTSWFFSDSRSRPAAVELVTDGNIVETAKDKPDRLSVSENCSLVIKKVTDEDVGRYDCRQFRSGQTDDQVYLSVVTMTEHKDNDEVKFNCSVSTYLGCKHKVKWLSEGPDNRDMTTLQYFCSATASFSTSELLKCKVTDGYNGEVKVFPFRRQTSGEDATTTGSITAAAPTTTPEDVHAGWSVLDSMTLVLRVAELLLVTVIVVLLIRAQGNRRPPDRNTVQRDGDGHEGAVNYENVGDPSVSVRLP